MHVGSIQFRMLGLLAIGSITALIACGGGGAGGGTAANVSVSNKAVPVAITTLTLTPATLSLTVNGQTQFTVDIANGGSGDSSIVWSALKGTITNTGLYTAPATAGSDVVTACLAQAPSTFATTAVTVVAAPPATPSAPVPAPLAPTLSGPVEIQASGGPYTASVDLEAGLSVEWSISGGTILHGANLDTVQFLAGSDPDVSLTCTVSNASGSAASSMWMVALPFVPRNHLADLKAAIATNRVAIEAEVASGDPAVYYRTSYYLHGLAAAAEATGDTQVMDTLVGYITQMISLAQPLVRNGVTYQAWAPWDVNGNPQQLDTFQAASPLARTAAIIAGNPDFMARYSANYTQIVAFVDQLVFKYWFDKQNGVYANPQSSWLGGYVPWLSTAQGGWGKDADFWNDKTSHVGAISAWMYQATKSPLYLEYATRIAADFRTHVSVVNGCWVWDHGCYPAMYTNNIDGSPDTSHANREPMMVASMYEAGISFQLADLQAMAATLTDLIWNQSQTSPMFTNYIDGGNVAYGTSGPWANGNIYHGWNVLGKYSQKAMLVLALTDQILQQGGYNLNASMPTNGSSWGLVELAGTQALNSTR